MKYYEYDTDGWLIGWHEDAARPNSTTQEFLPIQPRFARWDGSAWVSDTSKNIAVEQAETTKKNKLQQAVQVLRAFDADTATAADVRSAIGSIILIVNRLGA